MERSKDNYEWPCADCLKLVNGICFANRGICWKKELKEWLNKKLS
ncbi:MAG: hypothetical protein ACI4S1_10010 [Roseburia sp.]